MGYSIMKIQDPKGQAVFEEIYSEVKDDWPSKCMVLCDL